MVAKISHNPSLLGILSYNHKKVLNEMGEVIYSTGILHNADHTYKIPDILLSFEPYLIANQRTKKPVIHISINPDPRDNLSREQALTIIKEYLQEMGYGEQPYIIYEHNDTGRKHYHIVTLCIDKHGKKIKGDYEKKRSLTICRKLEQKYNLHAPTYRERIHNGSLYKVDHNKGDIHRQIKEVAGTILGNYRFQNFQQLATLMELYGISIEHYPLHEKGKTRMVVLYQCLDEKGNKTGTPLFSSALGRKYTYKQIEKICGQSKKGISTNTKEYLRKRILTAKGRCRKRTATELQEQLRKQNIDVVFRYNQEGKLYGSTFIDHNSCTILNGSALGNDFTASSFDTFLDGAPQMIADEKQESADIYTEEESHSGGWYPTSDKDEEAWNKRMRKKKKKNNPKL